MSKEEWAGIYRAAWDIYYTPDHLLTILRRAGAFDLGLSHLSSFLFLFSKAVEIENLHPLQGGVFRRKYRRDRRYGMPLEPVWRFYPKTAWEFASKTIRMLHYWLALERMRRKVQSDPARHGYTDAALNVADDDATETLELFTHNEGAREEVARTRRVYDLTHGRHEAHAQA